MPVMVSDLRKTMCKLEGKAGLVGEVTDIYVAFLSKTSPNFFSIKYKLFINIDVVKLKKYYFQIQMKLYITLIVFVKKIITYSWYLYRRRLSR